MNRFYVRLFRKIVISICIVFSSSIFAIPDVDLLSIGGGIYSVCKDKYKTGQVNFEYKFHQEFHKFRPILGGMVSFSGSLYGYLGIEIDLVILQHIFVCPSFAPGLYYKGNGRDLGFPLEFRSAISAGWRFSNYSRLGIQFYHLSNASLGKRNPGVESLIIFYSIPIGKKYVPFKKEQTK